MRAVAVCCALAALVVEVWLVGFLLNLVPYSVDAPLGQKGFVAWGINLALLAQFGGVHSLMARPRFKQWWTTMIPPALERGAYLLVSAVTLGLLLALWQPLPHVVWNLDSSLAIGLVTVAFVCGLALLLWAVLSMDPWGFHGLRQVFQPGSGEPPFSTRGPYSMVRHPIQSGLILMLWSTPTMTMGHLLFAVALTAYSVIATLGLEERDLVAALGERYRLYQRRVPALLPFTRKP